MKDKIIAYGKEYTSNFKQNPLSATAVLIMQIIFVLGWGVYFYYILGNIITIVIPGQSGPKSNIYVECADIIIQTLVYTYIFCRLFPNMFAINKGFRLKLYAILISAVFALIRESSALRVLYPASAITYLPLSGLYKKERTNDTKDFTCNKNAFFKFP